MTWALVLLDGSKQQDKDVSADNSLPTHLFRFDASGTVFSDNLSVKNNTSFIAASRGRVNIRVDAYKRRSLSRADLESTFSSAQVTRSVRALAARPAIVKISIAAPILDREVVSQEGPLD